MSQKRILVVQEDRLLSNFYREHLENGGFVVESVRSGDAALQVVQDRQPDAVVIDSLTPGREAEDVIREIRASTATKDLPIVALPGTRAPMTKAVHQAGATRVLSRSMNMPAELTDAVQAMLGRDRTEIVRRCVPLQADESWVRISSSEAPETLNLMRRSLQAAMRDSNDRAAIRSLLQEVHGLTERLALFGQRSLFTFAAALEALIFDLNRFSEQSNPSTLRTIGQAIDFCAILLEEGNRRQIKDPASGQILIVDDEDGARKIVMAAMGMVNLRSLATETPSSALAAMRNQTFDLIFLDVGLPEMSGFDVCTRARAIARNEKTPVVFITGMTTFQNRVQSSLSGGNDFIGKPFNIPELGLKALIWVFKGQLALI
ncbi:MAG: response regulator [Chthoniobacteraceae bacterium]